jgi:hypothetical protein
LSFCLFLSAASSSSATPASTAEGPQSLAELRYYELFQREVRRMLDDVVIQPLCREVETDLRLHIHSVALQQESLRNKRMKVWHAVLTLSLSFYFTLSEHDIYLYTHMNKKVKVRIHLCGFFFSSVALYPSHLFVHCHSYWIRVCVFICLFDSSASRRAAAAATAACVSRARGHQEQGRSPFGMCMHIDAACI